jgi:regulator of sigma E protease
MFVIGVPGIKPLIDQVTPDTVAYEAGLRGGEEIIAVNGEATPTWQSAMEAIIPLALLQEPVKLTVFDRGLSVERVLDTGSLSAMQKPEVMAERLGLKPYRLPIAPVIDEVVEDSAAQIAGLRSGDEIHFIGEQPIDDWSGLVEVVSANPGKPLMMVVLRDGRELNLEVRPRAKNIDGKTVGRIGVSPRVDEKQLDALRAEMRHRPMDALGAALGKTWEMSTLTLRMVGEMIMGRASVENISGPIGIAQYAKRSAVAGVSQFLAFLALISLSLGVLNLLPIPVLDGGHLFFYLVEMLKGSPVSEQTEMLGQRVGLALILALMMLAIYNDLVRLAG